MENTTINRLPVKTWRYLKINQTSAELPDASRGSAEISSVSGITAETVDFADELGKISSVIGDVRRESFVAGKEPIYGAQSLISGMGADADGYLARSGAYSLRITADESYDSGNTVDIKAKGVCALFIRSDARQRLRIRIDADEADFLSVRLIAGSGSDTELRISHFGGGRDSFFCDIGGYLEADARMELRQIALDSKKIFLGTGIELAGDRSAFDGSLAYLRSGGELEDINYDIIQRGRATESVYDVKGVLFAGGEKTLRDTIDFRRGAAGSKASEQENVLLAESDESGIINRSIPLILCEEEDVDGRHGAAIGRMDPDVLVYMSSRGFDAEEAKKLLIRGHSGSVAKAVGETQASRADEYLDRLLK